MDIRLSIILAAVLVVVAAPGARADEPPVRSYDAILLRHCSVDFDRSTMLGASSTGVLQDCLVSLGDAVKARQVLGRLQDEDARAEFDHRSAAAQNDIAVRLRQAKFALAKRKVQTSQQLNSQRFVSSEDLYVHKLEADTAALELEEAEHHHALAQIEKRRAEAMVHTRELIAPHDGVVVGVFKSEGETITPADPIIQIVNTSWVRVTAHLDVVDSWRVRTGQTVRISPDIPGAELDVERETFRGKVVFVDSQVKPETQTVKIIARVENRDDLLKGGLSARMEIFLKSVPDQAAEAVPAPGPSAKPVNAPTTRSAAASLADQAGAGPKGTR